VSCFAAETTVGANVGGVQKSSGVLEHKIPEQMHEGYEKVGDKESPKACTRLRSCASLYTCPWIPFYRKIRGLLHSETTL
jgi:hypothetical protein